MVYYPHAPYGFPDERDYTGTLEMRIADLRNRGYGNNTIQKWINIDEAQKTAAKVDAVIKSRLAVVDAERASEAKIQLQREQKIYDAGVAEAQRLQKVKNQEITFNEQTNSGDFNETPITDINLSNGCSECSDPIIEKELPNNNMKFVGIAAIGIIGLLVVRK
tara:strand:+ start:683 stop:1171 length:489 start_codon:yes stop_codon:yes gene_type:complete